MKITVIFASDKNIDDLIDVYSEWDKFKGILPDALIEVDTYRSLVKYFDGSVDTRKYLLATSEKGDALGACYIDTSFMGLESVRLGDMMVKEIYRGKGAGSALVEKVIEFAKQNSVAKVWLWTQEELAPAIRFYEKRGFIFEGRQRKQFCSKDALLYGLAIE